MVKKVTLLDKLDNETLFLIYIIQNEGRAYGPQITKFAKKLGVKAPSTVYSNLEMLEQTGVIKKEPLTLDEMSMITPHGRTNVSKWIVVGTTLSDLSRLFVYIRGKSRGLEGYALGKVINSNWYVKKLKELITPQNRELKAFFDALWTLGGTTGITFDYDLDIREPRERHFGKGAFDDFSRVIEQKMIEQNTAAPLKKMHLFLEQSLKGIPMFALFFYRLFYLARISRGRWPDGSEVSQEDIDFLTHSAAKLRGSLTDTGSTKDDFEAWAFVVFEYLNTLVIEYEGFGFRNAKDPDVQEFMLKKMQRITNGE